MSYSTKNNMAAIHAMQNAVFFEEGINAFKEKQPVTNNPYDELNEYENHKWDMWNKGWTSEQQKEEMVRNAVTKALEDMKKQTDGLFRKQIPKQPALKLGSYKFRSNKNK